jgi:phosphatidylglycerol:prolipoprotein diacylglycerol transferase
MALTFPDIDPIALSIGPLEIRWYALSYLATFMVGLYVFQYFLKKYPSKYLTKDMVEDLLTWIVVGVILGGRLGYVLFYNLPYYADNPFEAIKIWQGGMAFHGGLIGVITAMILFAWKHKIPFFAVADRMAVVTPIGLFFGRIANFINGELFGRASDTPWAMIFEEGDVARHPSQLYQAATEGITLFILLFILLRIKSIREKIGIISGAFLCGYGIQRFFVEYTRQPDAHIGFLFDHFSMGQILCIPMVIAGVVMIYCAYKNHAKT